jgi:hypothetical protein
VEEEGMRKGQTTNEMNGNKNGWMNEDFSF